MSSNGQQRRIYLGMPGYGKQTADAGRSFWRASRDMSQVINDYRNGSLLASNFNQLWCGALNRAHRGERIDYFAMLHDDIGTEDFWLDKSIEELNDRGLDVLGVVAPIKDTRGLTSLALHRDDDNWMPLRRLSMHDVFQLPETFTSENVGAPLLLNTGCWVCKFNVEWAKQVHFEVNDRIVFNRAMNCYQAQTESEDWFFSRLLHELGLKIGATRKIHLMHRGEMDFTNMRPWGSSIRDTEHENADYSDFPRDVAGWLSPQEGKELARLATGKRVLEIGSFCGLSTVCLARTAEHVTAVDYFDGRATPDQRDTLPDFLANIERYGVASRVKTSNPDLPYPLDEYDLAFIDGAHDYESVQCDIARALDVLASDGLIVFHDYRLQPGEFDGGWDEGVTRAVDSFISSGSELISRIGTLAIVRPAKSLLEV